MNPLRTAGQSLIALVLLVLLAACAPRFGQPSRAGSPRTPSNAPASLGREGAASQPGLCDSMRPVRAGDYTPGLRVAVSPSTVATGDGVTVGASGYPPHVDVTLDLRHVAGSDRASFGTVSTGRSDGAGSVTVTFRMPDARRWATNDFGAPIPCLALDVLTVDGAWAGDVIEYLQ